MEDLKTNWNGSVQHTECGLHQLSPYIGKMKSTMARSLIQQFSQEGDTVYDPFCGAGTVALESWITKRNIIAGDLSPYAYILTMAKMNPPKDIEAAIVHFESLWGKAIIEKERIDLRKIPLWIRIFFHQETLREALALRNILIIKKQWFFLSCLLGILHHWRPGFLSFPCSHTVPYLKDKLFSRENYPDLYAYRDVYPRMVSKIKRAFKRVPRFDYQASRKVSKTDAVRSQVKERISSIITSPPYMNSLSYARDNRLRLWFLGVEDYRCLEPLISPRKSSFLKTMQSLLSKWSELLEKNGPCVLVLGAVEKDKRYHDLPSEIIKETEKYDCGLRVTSIVKNLIPDNRRARNDCQAVREETIVVLRKEVKIYAVKTAH
jgi:hypothetical protein